MHFPTGGQISYAGVLIFYVFSTRKKGCVTAADLIDLDENLHCFTRPLSSCNIKISVVSQCRFTAGISWLIIIWTHSFCLFFTDWQLAPAGLRSDSVTVDAEWQRLNLLTDSRHTSPETQTQIWNWLRQRPPSTSVVHYLQTVHCGLPLRQRWQNSCIFSSCLMTTPYEEEMLPTKFEETAQSEQHWHSDPDIESLICRKVDANSKVLTNAHLDRICLKMGAKGMFCSSKLQVK